MAVGDSSSRVVEAKKITTHGVVITEDTTDSVPTSEGVSSEKLDPPTCLSLALYASGLLHLPPYFIYLYALGTIACLFVGGGVNGK